MDKSVTTPVHILSGFLGSGKTSLLKAWLEHEDLNDVALLINEFGEVGIDHLLLGEVAPDTVLLPSGCVCCKIRGELKDALMNLYIRRARDELPPFSKIILETTGLADPSPVLSTLLHDPQLMHHFSQGTLVTVVDAEHGRMQSAEQPEWLAQVTAADRLLISKTDRISEEALPDFKAWLQSINPMAEIDINRQALAQAENIFSLRVSQGSTRQRFRWLGNASSALAPVSGMSVSHPTHPLTETCVITLASSMNWSAFAIWLSMLLHRHGASVLRMKGILKISDVPTPIVIHGVQHILHPPVHMEDWPEALESSQLVFILRGLRARDLQNGFHQYMQSFGE